MPYRPHRKATVPDLLVLEVVRHLPFPLTLFPFPVHLLASLLKIVEILAAILVQLA
jgi:ABC-type uncharacterized transport system permease subunit